MKHLFVILAACLAAFPAFAKVAAPPFTEAVLPIGSDLYAVAIGPGGPGKEFGSDATNGGLYKITSGGAKIEIPLSDGQGLRNPTGLTEIDGQIFMVDGNQILSVSPDGTVTWRVTLKEEGVFLYDVEILNETTLIVSDFGRGVFVSVAAGSGKVQPYLPDVQIKGLARFEIAESGIFAVSWGADDAWDSALHLVSNSANGAKATMLTDGFGNLESVEVIDGQVVVGGYRGHKAFPNTKLMHVARDGTVKPLGTAAATKGVSDMYFAGSSVWLTYFYDAAFERLPARTLLSAE